MLKKGDERSVRSAARECLQLVKRSLAKPALREQPGKVKAVAATDDAAFRELLALYERQELAPKEEAARCALAQVEEDRAAIELLLTPNDETNARFIDAEFARKRYEYRDRIQQALKRVKEVPLPAVSVPFERQKRATEFEGRVGAALAADDFEALDLLLTELVEHAEWLEHPPIEPRVSYATGGPAC